MLPNEAVCGNEGGKGKRWGSDTHTAFPQGRTETLLMRVIINVFCLGRSRNGRLVDLIFSPVWKDLSKY